MPAAEKVTPLTVKSKSAVGQIIAALFPPNSNNVLPSLAETNGASSLPIWVLPVADIRGIFGSLHKVTAASLPPLRTSIRSLWSTATLSHIFFMESAHSVA